MIDVLVYIFIFRIYFDMQSMLKCKQLRHFNNRNIFVSAIDIKEIVKHISKIYRRHWELTVMYRTDLKTVLQRVIWEPVSQP